jgi:hypothetical protein
VHLLLLAQSADPTGLAHGRWPVPSWAILLAGGVVTVLAVAFLVVRARGAKKPSSPTPGPGTRP